MLNTSAEYKVNIYQPVREFKARARINPNNPNIIARDIIKHDFSNKLAGNVISNPSNAKYRVATSALAHYNDFTVEATHDQYRRIKSLDGTTWTTTHSSLNIKAYHYYGFDIIGILTDYFGPNIWQGKTSIADKIVIAKGVITRLSVTWHGYGSSPTGNKATIQTFSVSLNKWDNANEKSHSSNVIDAMTITSLSSYSTNTPANKIDPNGFFHALVFSEAANGTIATYLTTDYIFLEIETDMKRYDDEQIIRMNILEEISILNESLPSNELELTIDNTNGDFDYLTFENMHKILASKPRIETELGLVLSQSEGEVISSNFKNKILASTVENGNIYKYKYADTIWLPNQMTAEPTQPHYDAIYEEDGSTSYISTITTGYRAQKCFSFDVIRILTDMFGIGVWNGKTSTEDKVAIAQMLISDLTVNWFGYGTSTANPRVTVRLYSNITGTWDDPNGKETSNTSITNLYLTASNTYSGNTAQNKIGPDGFIHFGVFSEPSDGVIRTGLRTDYVDIKLTINPFLFIEWMPSGTFFLSNWRNEISNKIITIIANDYFNLFNDISYDPVGLTNLKDLAIDVLTKGGVPSDKIIIDNSLDAIIVNPFPTRLDSRTALQHIGIASVSAVFQDRYGNVVIKPFKSIDESANYINYTTIQPSLYGYPGGNVYIINNTGGGMKYLDFDQMYDEPTVSLERSVYQLVVNVYTGGNYVEQIYTNDFINGTNGQSFTIDNPLINSEALASQVAEWFMKEINYNAFYAVNWRQNPALECTDIILVEDSFNAEKQSRIIRQELNYQGYLEGITESRGGV